MISVEASWQDQSGTSHSVTARMENKSFGGACIRIGTRVEVGSKLGIRGRWEQFFGTAKYCVIDEGSYLVGIQRDQTKGPTLGTLVSAVFPPPEEASNSAAPVSQAQPQNLQGPQESKGSGIVGGERKIEREPTSYAIGRTAATPRPKMGERVERRYSADEFDDPRRTRPRTRQVSPEEETGKKRKRMRRNWFGLANKDVKPDAAEGSEAANGNNGSRPLEMAPSGGKAFANTEAEDTADFPIELLAIEDVYRTSGVRTPRKDYGINKVVEMLRSEHMRDLPKEMKRAAVLMALDAAGIPMEEVLRDAKARQDALDSYEADRRTQIEAEWARKTKENAQILAELEGVKLHHMGCINRNLDRIVREKATFGEWLMMKQQECQNIAEAATLCLKSSAPEPEAEPQAGKTVCRPQRRPRRPRPALRERRHRSNKRAGSRWRA